METYRHVSQIINTNLNHTKGLLAPENTPYALPFTFLRGAKPVSYTHLTLPTIA